MRWLHRNACVRARVQGVRSERRWRRAAAAAEKRLARDDARYLLKLLQKCSGGRRGHVRVDHGAGYLGRKLRTFAREQVAVIVQRFLNRFHRVKMRAGKEVTGTRAVVQCEGLGG